MRRLVVVGLIPPLVVATVAVLLIPSSAYSAGAVVGLVFVAVLYFAFISLPIMAPRGEDGFIHSASTSLAVWPYVIAASIIALVAVAVSAISWKWILAADVVVLGLTVSTVLLTTSTSERDAGLNDKAARSVSDLRRLAQAVESTTRAAVKPEVKQRAERVAEQIRLSPFKGSVASAAIEEDIERAVHGLATTSDPADLLDALDRISRLVVQRNQIVRIER